MIHVIKIALFAIVNALGFYALPTLANVAIMLDVYPQFSTATDLNTFNNLFYGIGMWVWVAAAVVLSLIHI